MSDDTPVSDLLFRWEAARREGQSVSPEELCRDCPDQLDGLKRQIEVLELIRPLLGQATDAPATVTGAATDSAPAPSTAAGRYRPLRPHARGGLGEVLVAEDEELNRSVALKRIQDRYADHPTSRARFLRQ